jgi:hypothetical protein
VTGDSSLLLIIRIMNVTSDWAEAGEEELGAKGDDREKARSRRIALKARRSELLQELKALRDSGDDLARRFLERLPEG